MVEFILLLNHTLKSYYSRDEKKLVTFNDSQIQDRNPLEIKVS